VVKFDTEQAVAFAAVQQLVNSWAHELDMHNGLHIGDLVTEDCSYAVGGAPAQGRAAVEGFYRDRLARMLAQPEGVPTMRHTLSNLCVSFRTADEVSITFSLIFFSTAGMASGIATPDPAAVADVRMDCRRGDDEHWRIARFESNQPFRRG
jgi:hypothetical protein